jgi:hypothetical protein
MSTGSPSFKGRSSSSTDGSKLWVKKIDGSLDVMNGLLRGTRALCNHLQYLARKCLDGNVWMVSNPAHQ